MPVCTNEDCPSKGAEQPRKRFEKNGKLLLGCQPCREGVRIRRRRKAGYLTSGRVTFGRARYPTPRRRDETLPVAIQGEWIKI